MWRGPPYAPDPVADAASVPLLDFTGRPSAFIGPPSIVSMTRPAPLRTCVPLIPETQLPFPPQGALPKNSSGLNRMMICVLQEPLCVAKAQNGDRPFTAPQRSFQVLDIPTDARSSHRW